MLPLEYKKKEKTTTRGQIEWNTCPEALEA
jgi:hypothetical protein